MFIGYQGENRNGAGQADLQSTHDGILPGTSQAHRTLASADSVTFRAAVISNQSGLSNQSKASPQKCAWLREGAEPTDH
jgi:hypothetical protein